jgi:hypothetical protein
VPTPLVSGAAGESCRQGVVSTDPLNADVLAKEPAQRSRPDATRRRVRHQESQRRPDPRNRQPAHDRSHDGVADLLVLFADELERREPAPEQQIGETGPAVSGKDEASVEPPSESSPAAAPARPKRGRPKVKGWVVEVIAVGVVAALAVTANGIRRDGSRVLPSSSSLSERAAILPAFPRPREQVERRVAQPEKTSARKRSARRTRTRRDRAAADGPARTQRSTPVPYAAPASPRVVQVRPPVSGSAARAGASTSEFLP